MTFSVVTLSFLNFSLYVEIMIYSIMIMKDVLTHYKLFMH